MTTKPQDQRDIEAREALEVSRDVWAESAARTCIPENKTGIIWALSNVMREFDHRIGDGPHTDRACDTVRDAITAVIATYDRHAKIARPAPEALEPICSACNGAGSIATGCDELSQTLCRKCDGTGLVAPEALGAAKGVELSDAEIDAIQRSKAEWFGVSRWVMRGFARAILAKAKVQS